MSSIVIGGDTSGTITLQAPSVAGSNTITLPAATGTVAFTASPVFTGSITLPTWTTSTRPGSPTTGMMGFNTTLGQVESYNGSAWVVSSTAPTYSASYLVVAGGGSGAGGNDRGAGGGAGGYITGTATLSVGTTYSAVVGGGGASSYNPATWSNGTAGSNSTFPGATTAIGGGGGGSGSPAGGQAGGSGGSGGGAGGNPSGGSAAVGSGTPGQGNA